MAANSVEGFLDLLLREPDDELSRVLYEARILLLKHPVAARGAFRALAAEGRLFGETEEGRQWKARLVGSELIRRGRSVWEVATLNMLDSRSPRLLPSQLIEAFAYALSLPELEPALARSLEPPDDQLTESPP